MENHYTETIRPLIKGDVKLYASATSDVGRVRKNNEDSFICQYVWGQDNILAVAIDGVGGYEGGEVASQIAREEIANFLEQCAGGEKLTLLKQAVNHANNRIFEERQKREGLSQMSCVLTASLVDLQAGKIHMAHVGDTRLYQYRNGEIVKLSHDHSLVGYREEIGELTEEEAMHHPQRNIIGRDLGSEYHQIGDNFIETATFQLLPNSTFLLCSDGLCDMITSSQMKYVLAQNLSVEDKVQKLIQSALDAGGKDNVTVVLVNYQGREPVKPVEIDMGTLAAAPETSEKPKKSRMGLLVVISLIVGFVVGGVSYWALIGRQDQNHIALQQDSIADLDSIVSDREEVILELADSVPEAEEYIDSIRPELLQEIDSARVNSSEREPASQDTAATLAEEQKPEQVVAAGQTAGAVSAAETAPADKAAKKTNPQKKK